MTGFEAVSGRDCWYAGAAIVDGKFYIDTELGRRAYEITKSLFEDQLSEWSYGFKIPPGGASTDSKDLSEWPGAQRILRKVTPFEVSLVFAGAGIGTQTLAVKSTTLAALEEKVGARLSKPSKARIRASVSYTHLTLPTTPYV